MIQISIQIIFLKPAENFFDEIELSARKKFFFCMRKTKSRIFGEWFKKMAGTKDIFEFKILDQGKNYRLFAFWDPRNVGVSLLVCTHGIIKKTDKTPRSEINRAEDIKKGYFENTF